MGGPGTLRVLTALIRKPQTLQLPRLSFVSFRFFMLPRFVFQMQLLWICQKHLWGMASFGIDGPISKERAAEGIWSETRFAGILQICSVIPKSSSCSQWEMPFWESQIPLQLQDPFGNKFLRKCAMVVLEKFHGYQQLDLCSLCCHLPWFDLVRYSCVFLRLVLGCSGSTRYTDGPR